MLNRMLALFFCISYSTVSFASQCLTDNIISNPRDFEWTHHPVTTDTEEYYTGTMEIGEASFVIDGETITTRAYRQAGTAYSIPGPTVTMTPGNKYILRFNNTLPYEAASAEHNTFKDPNISNIHTHGLHISGESPSDDVTRSFEGGFGGDFVYEIPADHMGGTYWYHAHHHGSTFLQVSAGAFGLLIIDDGKDGIPANVAAMTERQLIIAYLDPGVAGTGGDTLIKGTLSPTWTTNGTVAGNMCMPQNTWQHFRVLLADRDAKAKTVSIEGGQCEVALMARDGVWRTQVPKILTTGSIDLTGASRADLAVRCDTDAVITVNGTVVANIQVDSSLTPDENVHPFAEDGSSTMWWSAKRPAYLRDLRDETTVHNETVHMGARTINGNSFDKYVPTFTLPDTDIQEWNIKGAANHPFHLHIYHVQVQEDCGSYESGEYYDVVAANCLLRFNLNSSSSTVYAGRTIMHCHILKHEDKGAMGWSDIVGGIPAPSFPTNAGFSAYYPFDNSSTSPTTAATDLVVGTIEVGTVSQGGGLKKGQAIVTVIDDLGNLVADAVVSGYFTGTFNESIGASPSTGTDGTTTIETTDAAKGKISIQFCVTRIIHALLSTFEGEFCSS